MWVSQSKATITTFPRFEKALSQSDASKICTLYADYGAPKPRPPCICWYKWTEDSHAAGVFNVFVYVISRVLSFGVRKCRTCRHFEDIGWINTFQGDIKSAMPHNKQLTRTQVGCFHIVLCSGNCRQFADLSENRDSCKLKCCNCNIRYQYCQCVSSQH